MGFDNPDFRDELVLEVDGPGADLPFRVEFAGDSSNARALVVSDPGKGILLQAMSGDAAMQPQNVLTTHVPAQTWSRYGKVYFTVWENANGWYQCPRYPTDGSNKNDPQWRKNNIPGQIAATVFWEV